MTREESIKWIDEEIRWENECQSKHPIKEALYEARKALEQKPCKDAVSRAEVKKIAKEMYLEVANMELDAKTISDCISCTASKCREVLEGKLQDLPPVTPQEPKPMVEIELDYVIKQKYIEREVLDKIRAEMLEEMIPHSGTGEEVIQAYVDGLKKGLEILDKCKAESEGE